jgi:hypothetical protein
VTPQDASRQAVAREVAHGEQALSAARALQALGMRNDALSRVYHAPPCALAA